MRNAQTTRGYEQMNESTGREVPTIQKKSARKKGPSIKYRGGASRFLPFSRFRGSLSETCSANTKENDARHMFEPELLSKTISDDFLRISVAILVQAQAQLKSRYGASRAALCGGGEAESVWISAVGRRMDAWILVGRVSPRWGTCRYRNACLEKRQP